MGVEYIIIPLGALILSVVLYMKWCFTYWEKRKVYTRPPSIPFGNALKAILLKTLLGEELKDFYDHIRTKGLKYGGYYIFGRPFFIPVNVELVRNILSVDFQYFTDRSVYINEELDPLSGILFNSKAPKWKALRTKASSAFTSSKMKTAFQNMTKCSKDLLVELCEFEKRSEPIDSKEILARYTTDVVGSFVLGIDCKCLQDSKAEFRKYGKKAFADDILQVLKTILTVVAPDVLTSFSITVIKKDLEAFFLKTVNKIIEFRKNEAYPRKDFMQHLIDLKDKALTLETKSFDDVQKTIDYYQDRLSVNEIAAQAFGTFIAGFETPAVTFNFLLYELSIQPKIQEKLRQEINTVLAKHNGDISYNAIMDMTYLDQCVNESLRKYPPFAQLFRECMKTYSVPESDFVIEKGSRILIPVYGIHHDPEFYPNPEKFDPERFSEKNIYSRPPFAFIPFGEGPRKCIGFRFGTILIKVGLAAMLREYKFILNPKTREPLRFTPRQMLLNTRETIWIDAQKI